VEEKRKPEGGGQVEQETGKIIWEGRHEPKPIIEKRCTSRKVLGMTEKEK